MILLLIIGFVALYFMVRGRAKSIKNTNASIARAMGDNYNPAAAGRPYRDALIITILVLAVTAVLAPALISKVLPLPPNPSPTNTTQVAAPPRA